MSTKSIKSVNLRSQSQGPHAQYPVQIRKNKVIRGPVLKSHYEKVTIQNGKLHIQVANKRKDKKRPSEVTQREPIQEPVAAPPAKIKPKSRSTV